MKKEETSPVHTEDVVPQSTRDDFLEALRPRENADEDVVLVVDDYDEIRALVINDLQRAVPRLKVYEAATGQEALARIEQIRGRHGDDPTLIILDLDMPEMDGWEVIRVLEKQYREQGREQGIPIVVLSSTKGEKGHVFKQSVHGDHVSYVPLVSVAKASCIDPAKYDAEGLEGLLAWTRHFLHRD